MTKHDWVILYHYKIGPNNSHREGAALIKNVTIKEALNIFYKKFPKRTIVGCQYINAFIKEDGEVIEKILGDSFEIELKGI